MMIARAVVKLFKAKLHGLSRHAFGSLGAFALVSMPSHGHETVATNDLALTADILTLSVILALHLLFYISLFVIAAWLGRRHLQSSTYWAHESHRDSLTGLLNRRGLAHALQHQIAQHAHCGSLLLVDIDNFKQINDNHGHDQGDTVLSQVAAVLKNTLRTDDIICRLGGEEFAIFISAPVQHQSEQHQLAFEQAQRLVLAVQQQCHIPANVKQAVTVSIGVTHYTTLHDWELQSYPQADAALYHAKRSGKNQACMYHDVKPLQLSQEAAQVQML